MGHEAFIIPVKACYVMCSKSVTKSQSVRVQKVLDMMLSLLHF